MLLYISYFIIYHYNTIGNYGILFKTSVEMNPALFNKWNFTITYQNEIYAFCAFQLMIINKELNKLFSTLKFRISFGKRNNDKYLNAIEYNQEIFVPIEIYYGLKINMIIFLRYIKFILEIKNYQGANNE